MPRDDAPPFAGYSGPRYTPVPDQLFDEQLPDLSGAELKVLLYVMRRTFGFKKDSDHIALSQMLHGIATRDGRILDRGVGLSKKTLLAAINSLEAKRIIFTTRRRSAERGNEPTTYRLNVLETEAAPCAPHGAETPPPSGEKLPQGVGGAPTPTPWRENAATQDQASQETVASNIRGEQGPERPTAPATAMTSPAQQARNPAQPEMAGVILRRRAIPVTADEREARAVLADYLRDIAREFGDRASLASSTGRALHLMRDADLALAAFLARLMEARAITRDRATGPGTAPRNRMGYFFAVLADLLGLTGERDGATATGDERPTPS